MELLKTLAAFGGAALGVVNLGLLIYKDYLRRGKLRVKVRRAEVRAIVDGDFDIHMDLELSAAGGAVYLRDLQFEHSSPVFDPGRGVSCQKVFKVVGCPGYSVLDMPVDGFQEKVKSLFASSDALVNLKIEDKEYRVISIVDRICVERSMDGFWDWPRSGWRLRLVHSEGEEVINFSFVVHNSSKVSVFCER